MRKYRRMRLGRLPGTLLTLGMAASGLAGAAQMTLPGLIEYGLKNNRELQGMRQRNGEAQGARTQAGLKPNPTLDLSLSNGAILRNQGYWDGSVGYSQMIELGGKRSRRIDLAESDIQAVKLEIRDRERNLKAQLQTAFVEALAAARNVETHEALLRLTEQSLTVVRARVEQGEAAALDLKLLQVEANRLRADLVLFRNQENRAMVTIRSLAGWRSDEELTLAAKLEMPKAVAVPDEALRQAKAERPDILFMKQAESSGEASIRLEKSNAVPNLTAIARYSYTYDFIQRVTIAPGVSVPVTDICPILTVGISIDLPWRNKNQGNIESAVARREGMRLRREHQELVAEQEVKGALARYEAAMAAARMFEKDVLGQSEENLRIVRRVYEQGELRLLDYLQEQKKLIDSQRTYTELLKETQLSLVDLEKAAGSPLEGARP